MKFLQFFIDLGVKVSPLHNKFKIESELPRHQALELMLIREAADKKALVQVKNPSNFRQFRIPDFPSHEGMEKKTK